MTKAWKTRILHKTSNRNNIFCNSARYQVATDAQVHEKLELRTLFLSSGINELCHVMRQLESSALEFRIASRRNLEDETEVNMNQMTIIVDQNISVVPILRLQSDD